jgi:sigma-B regulation protein RsbU (phosphoserine phosphatase)
MFATLFFGVLDPASGRLCYINGGHEPPLLIGPHGIKAELETTGPAVGFMPNSHFQQQEIGFSPGDVLIAYTDGITEARNSNREMFGEARLMHLLNQPVVSAISLMESVEDSIRAHMGEQTPSDDITMLAVQRLGEPD